MAAQLTWSTTQAFQNVRLVHFDVANVSAFEYVERKPYPTQWAPYPPDAVRERDPRIPRLRSPHEDMIRAVGEKGYLEWVEQRRRRMEQPRLRLPFWIGVGCAATGAFLMWRSG